MEKKDFKQQHLLQTCSADRISRDYLEKVGGNKKKKKRIKKKGNERIFELEREGNQSLLSLSLFFITCTYLEGFLIAPHIYNKRKGPPDVGTVVGMTPAAF